MAAHEKVKRIVADHVIRPIATFIHSQASSGIVLLAMAVVALIWANSAWRPQYLDLWHTDLSLTVGSWSISMDLRHWINDGLMAVFFLLVGLEIKREILVGELSSSRAALLPVFAAVGGMAVPALIYFALNSGQASVDGWAIPMATDIAFSLGVLALLGSRAPLGLKVFLAALAIVDDLGAVVVIALFYSGAVDSAALASCGIFVAVLAAMNYLGVRKLTPYMVVGALLWLAMLKSGVHATIAGVVLALTIPTKIKFDVPQFLQRGRELLARFEKTPAEESGLLNEDQQTTLHAVERAVEGVQMPLQRLESLLHTPVNFIVMPLFALANAGVVLTGVGVAEITMPITLGIALGLVIGKSVGIALFSWLAVRLNLAELPRHVGWRQIVGVAFLGGIGFTMSLFIAGLAFGEDEPIRSAKLGILLGSLVAGTVGAALIAWSKRGRGPASVEPE